MENSGTRVILVVLGILLVAGCAVGGYYLGWYMDKQAGDKQKVDLVAKSKLPQTYENKDLGIKFTYPGTWTIILPTSEDINKNIIVEKDTGSQFVYTNSDENGDTINVCDEDVPDGDGTSIEKCTFFVGTNFSFGRFIDEEKEDENQLAFYGIAEPADQSVAKKYNFKSADGFYYYVKSTADLTELDNIMKSVQRL